MRFIFFAILFYLQNTFAEYRVFVLKIENSKTKVIKTLKSTLDPNQYKNIYLLSPDETISYVDTWRCQGAVRNFKALCSTVRKPSVPSNETPPQNVQKKS
jgi:hypothetical protein